MIYLYFFVFTQFLTLNICLIYSQHNFAKHLYDNFVNLEIELNNQNVPSDCDCLGQFNCPCGNKDILYVMRSGQDRLMFKLNNKEKDYINELNNQQKQKQKQKDK